MNFRNYLRKQGELHPAVEPQDIVKMIYQAAFGAEHLLEDVEKAYSYFMEEYEAVSASAQEPIYENISEDICRVNLAAWKAKGLQADWLFRIFAASAIEAKTGEKKFFSCLEEADEEIAEGRLNFTYDVWEVFRKKYLENGIRAVHHSQRYREEEKPAYRIVRRCFMRLVPILEKAAHTEHGKRPLIIAIDGHAASGKTTMAEQLRDVLCGDIIHMDDFFLPPWLRTGERFSKAGNNVHHERFAEEVLPYLMGTNPFEYTRFDCSRMEFDPVPVRVEAGDWRIIEGSYSHHPELGDYADIKVFSTVQPELQMERIIARNGSEMAEIFRNRWIPMEEEYFSAYGIREKADIIIF